MTETFVRPVAPALALLAAGALAACIDFREGLKCDTTQDCRGLRCKQGVCGSDPSTEKAADLCAACNATDGCKTDSGPAVCVTLSGIEAAGRCRLDVTGGAGSCEAVWAVSGGSEYCACADETALRGEQCATTQVPVRKTCRTRAASPDLCVTATSGGAGTCRQKCLQQSDCPSGTTCSTLSTGNKACTPS